MLTGNKQRIRFYDAVSLNKEKKTGLTILVCFNHFMYLFVVSRRHDFNQTSLIRSSSLETEHEVKYEVASPSLDVTGE